MKKLILMLLLVLGLFVVTNNAQTYSCGGGEGTAYGRVVDQYGRAIRSAKVTVYTIPLTGHPSSVEPEFRYAYTNSYGYYDSFSTLPLCIATNYQIQASWRDSKYSDVLQYEELGGITIPTITIIL